MSNDNPAFNIKYILENDSYIIPIYQRNYAWGRTEITQLINDIVEFFEIEEGKVYNNQKTYYIGSLICFKRENEIFELIDGQQRHTTITLINLVLKNYRELKIHNTVSLSNLKFDSRKNVQRFIDELYQSNNFNEKVERANIAGIESFKTAINIISEEFLKRDFNVEQFANYFYNNVKLFRVEVPMDTDLNHYFEIMNNRGEQLEKHEIVKAFLMSKIKNDNKETEKLEQEAFAVIWDACSDMSNYIYFNFDLSNRQFLFEVKGDLKVEIDNFQKIVIGQQCLDIAEGKSLSEIIESYNFDKDFSQEEKPEKEKYKSVIDFPHFLLLVLKLSDTNTNIILDDKKLLEQFTHCTILPQLFIYQLMKYRTEFDKFIIKQDLSNADKQNWGIRTLNLSYEGIAKTIDDDEELVKLQTIFNHSTSSKNWLYEILVNSYYLDTKFSENIFKMACQKYDHSCLSYPGVSIYNLYFIDFLLWKFYKEFLQGSKKMENPLLDSLKGKIKKELFNQFRVKQLNSKEHLLPQAKAKEQEREVLNNLGNLCLISASQNSEGNKEHPIYKKERFINDNSSLKRLVMFESFSEKMEWGKNEIEKHEIEIMALVEMYTQNVQLDFLTKPEVS